MSRHAQWCIELIRAAHVCRRLGAEVVVADMFDLQQVQAALDGVDRLYFNPPVPPPRARQCGRLRGRRAALRRRGGGGVGAVAGQPRASVADDPAGVADSDKLFELLPDTAHVAVDPGYFADNYLSVGPARGPAGSAADADRAGPQRAPVERGHRAGRGGRAARPAPARRPGLPTHRAGDVCPGPRSPKRSVRR